MIIETSTGSVETPTRVTKDILPGMVAIPAGWEGNNLVTNDATMDPISGVPECTGLLCRVRPGLGRAKQNRSDAVRAGQSHPRGESLVVPESVSTV